MEEKIFFEYDDVKVTNARFMIGSQTYAMSNITSVKAYEEKPNRTIGILGIIAGIIIAMQIEPITGAIIAIVSVLFMFLQKTVYHVMLNTSGGETSALKTHQTEYLNKVVSALNKAIVHRG